MRAKLINEFKRGKDPEQKIGIGKHRPFIVGDKLICNVDLYKNSDNRLTTYNYEINSTTPEYCKDEVCYLMENRQNPYTMTPWYVVRPESVNINQFRLHWERFCLSKKELDIWFKRL